MGGKREQHGTLVDLACNAVPVCQGSLQIIERTSLELGRVLWLLRAYIR
jgi:hypothetical protein